MKHSYTIVVLMVAISFLSCQNKDLYEGPEETPDTNNNKSASDVDYSAPYIYNFSDEVKNVEAVITIKVNKDIAASNLTALVPPLKYNKTWLMMLTQDDCEQDSYCRTWAKINGKPVSSSVEIKGEHQLYYDYLQLVNADLPPTIISAQHSLGATDAAGNEVRFAITATVEPEQIWMNAPTNINKNETQDYYRFYMKKGLVWYNLMDMMNYGTGLAFHNVNASNEKDESDVLKHFYIAQDSIVKRLSGRRCKMLAEPDGNKTYTSAALKFPDIQTIAAQAEAVILYPFQVDTDLKDVLLNRELLDNPDDFESEIQTQLALPKEEREAICIGLHSADNTWVDFLQWVNDHYGQKGDDSVWFPSQEEYYEYNYYRIHGIQKIEQVDSRTIRVTATLPSGDYFYYPSTTINLSGIKSSDIVSISSNDAISGFSYADYDNGIMMNIDCRKHLVELATHYVEKYEKDKTNTSNKADAIYFVKLLKPSSTKENLLSRVY